MKKFLITLAIMLLPSLGVAQPINEWTIEHPTYTAKGDAIAYNDGGGWTASDFTILDQPQRYTCQTRPMKWAVRKDSASLRIWRGDSVVAYVPQGLFYMNMNTQATARQFTPTINPPTFNGTDTITFADIYPGVDLEIVHRKPGPQFDYIVKDITGWPADTYPTTGVMFGHRIREDLGTPPSIRNDDDTAWDGATDREARRIRHRAPNGKRFQIFAGEAEDSTSPVPLTRTVRKFLVRRGGRKLFMEGYRMNYLRAAATLPVRMHYETKTGAPSEDETWVEGTTYVVATFTIGAVYTITIEPGTFVKFEAGGGIINNGGLDVNGTIDNLVWFTTCDDQTVGEDVSAVAGCGDAPSRGNWDQLYICSLTSTQCDFEGAWVRYGGTSVARPPIEGDYNNGQVVLVNNVILSDSLDGTNQSGLVLFDAGDGGDPVNVTVTNSIFDCTMPVNSSGPCVKITNDADSAGINVFDNNLIITDGQAGAYALMPDGYNFSVRNNTIDVTNDLGYGMNAGTNGSLNLHDNLMIDAGYGYNVSSSASISHNTCFSCATNGQAHTTGSTGFNTTDPAHANHAESDLPALFATKNYDDYHLGTGNALIDGGSRAASLAGLDTYHAEEAGTDDADTLDRGFHYWTIAAAPSGPSCPGDMLPAGTIDKSSALISICNQLEIPEYLCRSETSALQSITINQIGSTDPTWYSHTLTESLREWCYYLLSDDTCYNYSEFPAIKAIAESLYGASFNRPDWSETPYYLQVGDCEF